ncbi:N-acetylmuramoyl-L-alanine amidase [Montanilutibacter psychrotolerans]|uniref:N-acetylmuramoyl-L-alanine amidase AmiC n=1 Tax=Montanilutibacter psychrotolerans TaxID=1327343 RepID=A0A3M8SV22_9GAMM|nr:N-acetylmuramoyl-L-alanine amidase [Lysobacter psychrotolerans]RNF85149.1 N-acetylmuramoyl-L-alanine amidase [Lysobacter psychrotolerans]
MRVKGATVQKFLLGAALFTALGWNLAHASEIKGVQVSTGATGTRAEIALSGTGEFKVISLHGPERLVVDLPASSLARGTQLPAGTGVVRSIRSGQPVPGTTRLVFDLEQPVAVLKPRIEQSGTGPRLVLEWPGDGVASRPATVPGAAAPAATTSTTTLPSAGTASTATAMASTPAPAATVPQATVPRSEATAPAVSTSAASPGLPSTAGAAGTPAYVAPDAASAAATTRLISELAARAATARGANAAGHPAPVSSAAAPAATLPSATVPSSSQATAPAAVAPRVPTTIATGVPTRIATGQPTPAPGAGTSATPPGTPSGAAATPAPVRTLQQVMRGGMRPLVIAIDAGHGGQDSGAVGLAGRREKDVTLAIARELARQINATPGLRAYLTRDTDVFIALPQRARLARSARADMFVSIHADAAENRAAKGSSVYVLSTRGASSQRARWLADKENASDLVGGVRLRDTDNTLTSVLLDLTQSGHMRASEDAANHVLSGLKRIGNNHKPHIERANFAVLRTSDMPAMLVETAFISNPDEERRLVDPAYQRTLARAVLDGVNTYFTQQPPPGTMYAARAQAQTAGAAGGSP